MKQAIPQKIMSDHFANNRRLYDYREVLKLLEILCSEVNKIEKLKRKYRATARDVYL